ncbi:MFS transporter [Kocuria sp. NPDC057446]|uniref:MFS transporter n=1 Tax=Kocuria sp. NPDC057446 TaxID=3346137 RepID=UPI0036CDE26B
MTRRRRPGAHLMLVLTATMAVGPLLTHSLSAMSPLVIEDLGLTETQFGLLATTTFFVAALTAVRTGRWADRLSARTLLVVMFGGAALAMLLTAAAPGYAVLLLAMVLSGLGQVMANPATNRLIRLHVPAPRRASWLGIKQAGVQASQLVAGLTFPALGLLLGWRTAVLVAVGVVLLLLVHGWWTVPDNHTGAPAGRPPRTAQPLPVPVRTAARPAVPGAVRAYAAAAALTGLGAQAANVYLPLYAHRALGLDVVAAGATVSVSALVGIASRVLWARVMDRPRADGFVLLAGMALGAAASDVLLIVAPLHPGLAWTVWPAAVLHGAAALAVSVVVMSAAMRAVPAERVGASTGVVTMGLYAGFCAGPLVLGGLLQLTGSFAVGWAVVLVCYLGCAALAVLARARASR